MPCWFFSITVIAALATTPAAPDPQDWRTSGDDPCACTDSMPYIIGPRPPVDTPAQIEAMVRDSRDPSCRVARVAVETLRQVPDVPAATVVRISPPP